MEYTDDFRAMIEAHLADAEAKHAQAVADFCAERDECLALIEQREAELQRRLVRFRQRIQTEKEQNQ